MMKLKLQYFGHLMWRDNSVEKPPMLEKMEDRLRRVQKTTRWLDGITDIMDMGFSKLQAIVKGKEPWCAAVQAVAKCWTWLSDWTTATYIHMLGEIRCFVLFFMCFHSLQCIYDTEENEFDSFGHGLKYMCCPFPLQKNTSCCFSFVLYFKNIFHLYNY